MAAKKVRPDIEKYLKAKGVRCPYCGSEDLNAGGVEVDAGEALQDVRCLSCDESWTDVYELKNAIFKTEEILQCQNCKWEGTDTQLASQWGEGIPDLEERLVPGDSVPYGECPKCRCFCYPKED